MSTSRVRVLTTENVEMIFQAAESDLGSVIHRIQGSQAHPVDENLNPAVPTWWGYGEGFTYPVREDGDLVRSIHELFDGLAHHQLQRVEFVSEKPDVI